MKNVIVDNLRARARAYISLFYPRTKSFLFDNTAGEPMPPRNYVQYRRDLLYVSHLELGLNDKYRHTLHLHLE